MVTHKMVIDTKIVQIDVVRLLLIMLGRGLMGIQTTEMVFLCLYIEGMCHNSVLKTHYLRIII